MTMHVFREQFQFFFCPTPLKDKMLGKEGAKRLHNFPKISRYVYIVECEKLSPVSHSAVCRAGLGICLKYLDYCAALQVG